MAAVGERMVVRPGEGRITAESPVGVVEKVHGRRTNGLISIIEHPITPGALARPTPTPILTSGRTYSRAMSALGSATRSSLASPARTS